MNAFYLRLNVCIQFLLLKLHTKAENQKIKKIKFSGLKNVPLLHAGYLN